MKGTSLLGEESWAPENLSDLIKIHSFGYGRTLRSSRKKVKAGPLSPFLQNSSSWINGNNESCDLV